MKPFSWTCPFCNRPVTITEENQSTNEHRLYIENRDGYRVFESNYIVCPNPDCNKISLDVALYDADIHMGIVVSTGHKIKTWQLIPQSKAQSFPGYIPKPILDDYGEACLIKDLSPEASATLSRRCLQGIIRDFWKNKVKPGKLANEIEQIKDEVDQDTWKAIDAVRSVGNIGAHMEEDVNVIIDVEPDEAELLIGLIEILLKDWYIAREQKKAHLKAVVKVAKGKKAARETGKSNAIQT